MKLKFTADLPCAKLYMDFLFKKTFLDRKSVWQAQKSGHKFCCADKRTDLASKLLFFIIINNYYLKKMIIE